MHLSAGLAHFSLQGYRQLDILWHSETAAQLTEGTRFLCNNGEFLLEYTTPHPRRQQYLHTLPVKNLTFQMTVAVVTMYRAISHSPKEHVCR